MLPELAHVNCWIFDLDLTLYSPEANIMAQVRRRIEMFVEDYFGVNSAESRRIREKYWQRYGTTLGGLMAEHDVAPEGYLDFVHDVDMSGLMPDAGLRTAIEKLPGRKQLFTNADAPYAARVLEARGLDGVFETVFDIYRMEHRPKPDAASYAQFCAELGVDPSRALFVEDSAHNLAPAKAMGMTTIWVKHEGEADSSAPEPYIDQQIDDVAKWLAAIHNNESR